MELSIKDIGKLLKKSWIIILVCIIVATAMGAVISLYLLEKEYNATSMIMVNSTTTKMIMINSTTMNQNGQNQNMTVDDYDLNVKLADSYSILSKSNRVLGQVIQKLNLNISTIGLAKMIDVSSLMGTDIIQISVTNTSPKFATDVTNTLADVFKQEVSNIMKMDNVQVIDYAKLPTIPVSPNIQLNTALSFIIGLIIGIIIAFLRYVLDDTIKEPEQITEIMGIPVIGSIPKIV